MAHLPHRLSTPVVRATGLRRSFGTTTVLHDLDLEIRPGELVALLGRSGSGKSTLLRSIAGLDPSPGEQLQVLGTTSVAFQEPRLIPWRRVLRNVELVVPRGLGDARAVARRALRETGLEHREHVWPGTLSGGEAQRVSLARALVREPDLLLLDEPFSALDALTRMSMHELVLDLWRRHGCAILLVTHDVDEALLLADRICVLDRGRLTYETPVVSPRPRRPDDPEHVRLRHRLLTALGVSPTGAGTTAEIPSLDQGVVA